MTYGELKNYIVEALGEDVVGVDQIIAGVRAGFGDLIARGYREFKHTYLLPEEAPKDLYDELMTIRKDSQKMIETFTKHGNGLITFKFPTDCLTILYVKAFFKDGSILATKLALNNPAIDSKQINGVYRTDFTSLDYNVPPTVIYFKKEKDLYLEWDIARVYGDIYRVEIGYYKSLPFISESNIRRELGLSFRDDLDIEDLEIPLSDDYGNVLVNFMVWYVASSNGREQEQLTVLKNEYKYSVEDLLARKSREDQYDETTAFVRIEG